MLPLPQKNLSHAVTTVFSVRINGVKPSISLDDLHENHAWKKEEEWAAENLHSFIVKVLCDNESDSFST